MRQIWPQSESYRYVITAVTWQVLYQLFRRYHHYYALRVYETHPCSGQYDCRSLYLHTSHGYGIKLFDINLISGNLHFWGRVDGRSLSGRYAQERGGLIAAYLTAPDPKIIIDEIASQVGLVAPGDKVPPSDPQVIIVGIMAETFQRYCLSREGIEIRSIVEDAYFCSFREGAKIFPVLKQLVASGDFQKGQQYWLLLREGKGYSRPVALLDFGGRVYFAQEPTQEWNVYQEYQHNGYRLDLIVDRFKEYL